MRSRCFPQQEVLDIVAGHGLARGSFSVVVSHPGVEQVRAATTHIEATG